MKLTITIDLDNAAFDGAREDGDTGEIRRILDNMLERLPYPLVDTNGDLNLHDINGNHCGTARIE